jgi:hypothetical protein
MVEVIAAMLGDADEFAGAAALRNVDQEAMAGFVR